jgi:hypothetical protein
MMVFELWNTESRNIVGAFATEAEALALVLDAIDEHGAEYVDTLALVLDDGDQATTLALGATLAVRARTSSAVASLGA